MAGLGQAIQVFCSSLPRSFVAIAENERILLILLVTLLQTCGQFAIFVYLAPLQCIDWRERSSCRRLLRILWHRWADR